MSIYPGASPMPDTVTVNSGRSSMWKSPLGGSLIGAGVGLIGDYFSGRQARNERRHAEQRMLDMDNTKHQREVRDLRKAGLNPILSTTQGAASAGNVPGPAPVPDYGGSVRQGVTTALQAAMLRANLDNVNADTIAKEAAARLTKATTSNVEAGLPTTALGVTKAQQEIDNLRTQAREIETRIEGGRISNELAAAELRALLAEKGAILAKVAPNAYERKQLNDIISGDMTPATAIKLLLQILNR